MGTTFSEWIIIQISVVQDFILKPLRFNAFIIDNFKFIVNSNVCIFTYDNSIYDSGLYLS